MNARSGPDGKGGPGSRDGRRHQSRGGSQDSSRAAASRATESIGRGQPASSASRIRTSSVANGAQTASAGRSAAGRLVVATASPGPDSAARAARSRRAVGNTTSSQNAQPSRRRQQAQ